MSNMYQDTDSFKTKSAKFYIGGWQYPVTMSEELVEKLNNMDGAIIALNDVANASTGAERIVAEAVLKHLMDEVYEDIAYHDPVRKYESKPWDQLLELVQTLPDSLYNKNTLGSDEPKLLARPTAARYVRAHLDSIYDFIEKNWGREGSVQSQSIKGKIENAYNYIPHRAQGGVTQQEVEFYEHLSDVFVTLVKAWMKDEHVRLNG